ncbi:uncharacterized protein PgNI_09033 [Pyricularia grisea]|uniref:Uncharacterized protein n=1 Tax=Pyricularia grisea TaxID=148305 RepID=A0A6P8AUM2_PYRGI|nr:uncharacterized protein PgNI_09033 [Pyricularia grisea]TLD05921.1 hypothetical protein PgNI_09033 [Pyricularia grisea]
MSRALILGLYNPQTNEKGNQKLPSERSHVAQFTKVNKGGSCKEPGQDTRQGRKNKAVPFSE